jgi:hypothetical protein
MAADEAATKRERERCAGIAKAIALDGWDGKLAHRTKSIAASTSYRIEAAILKGEA